MRYAILPLEPPSGKLRRRAGRPGRAVQPGLRDAVVVQVSWDGLYVSRLDLSLSARTPGDGQLKPLQQLTALRYLRLWAPNVSDGLAHLKNLTKLKSLDLCATPITDAGLLCLHGLSNLVGINLWGTRVTDQGIAELRRALPGVVVRR